MLADYFYYPVILDNLGYLLVGRLAEGQPGGLLLTVLMALGAGVLALLLGFVLAVVYWFSPRSVRVLLWLVGELVRGIPLLLLIFWLYFLLPMLLGKAAPDALSVVAALGLFNGVSVMVSLLAGLNGLPQGQVDAAAAAGFKRWQTLLWILLPQVLGQMLPSFVNLFVALIKDTSLAFVVSVPELTLLSSQVNNREQVYPLEIFLFAGLLYFLLCTFLSRLAAWLDGRLAWRRRLP